MKTNEEIIRACFAAYEARNRSAIEAIIAEDFTFSSPLDDNINREQYFERCWPNSEHLDRFDIQKLFINGDEAFVQYEAHSKGKPPFRNTEFLTLRNGRITHVDVYFGREDAEAASQEEIRSILEARREAMQRKDVAAMLSCYADDCVRFSLAPPLQSEGDMETEMREWFNTFSGGLGCELKNLTLHVGTDLATCHSFNHLTGTKVNGGATDVWFRETLVLRLIDGRWRIVHCHESVPFYMDGSLKAAVDLKPE